MEAAAGQEHAGAMGALVVAHDASRRRGARREARRWRFALGKAAADRAYTRELETAVPGMEGWHMPGKPATWRPESTSSSHTT